MYLKSCNRAENSGAKLHLNYSKISDEVTPIQSVDGSPTVNALARLVSAPQSQK